MQSKRKPILPNALQWNMFAEEEEEGAAEDSDAAEAGLTGEGNHSWYQTVTVKLCAPLPH